jgi:hypothetical protein
MIGTLVSAEAHGHQSDARICAACTKSVREAKALCVGSNSREMLTWSPAQGAESCKPCIFLMAVPQGSKD